MARKTGMIQRQREKRRKEVDTSFRGFNFRFDDVELKTDYVAQWNEFNSKLKTTVDIPKPPSISYIEAVSLVRGKQYKKLTRLVYIKEQDMDYDWEAEGKNHKEALFNEENQSALSERTVSNYIKRMDKFLAKLAQYTGTSIQGLLDRTRVKYNVVWYTKHKKSIKNV